MTEKENIILGSVFLAGIILIISTLIVQVHFNSNNVGKTAIVKSLNIEGKVYNTEWNLFGAEYYHVRFINKQGAVQEMKFRDSEVEIND